MAMTLDGKIATRTGESQWITSEESRAMVQALRHSADAIVTGSGTFLKDRPQMTDRTGLPRRRELLRIVMDRRGRIRLDEIDKRIGWSFADRSRNFPANCRRRRFRASCWNAAGSGFQRDSGGNH